MTDKVPTNKKKVRGWPRRIAQLENWGRQIAELDLNYFDKRGKNYERCYLDPWYRLVKRNPPAWYVRIMTRHFITAFSNWDKVLSKRNQPYDLQVWFYSKEIIRSEICVEKVENLGDKVDYFSPSTSAKPFPTTWFTDELYRQLEWELCDDLNYFDKEDVIEMEGNLENLDKKGYGRVIGPEGQEYFTYKLDEVWVGRMKNGL